METDFRAWLRGHIWALDLVGLDFYAPAWMEALAAEPTNAQWATAVLARTRAQPPGEPEPFTGPVAHVPIFGVLSGRASLMQHLFGGTALSSLRAALAQAIQTPSVRSILLEVDSPGGSVYQTSETWRAIKAADAIKPVTAVVTGCGASAAYWLASAARKVIATPSAEVGGVGVYGVHADRTGLYTAKGITHTVIAAGAHKSEGLDVVPLTEEAKAGLQRRVDAAYTRFTADVAAGRRTTPDRVRVGFGEGRVLAAEDALAAGLVDSIQTMDETIAGFAGVVGDSRRREELAALCGELRSA